MKRTYVIVAALIGAALVIGAAAAQAQSAMLNLPRASQRARVTQRIGITDLTIDYSRPLVAGRKVFGGLLAYGQVWRAGANDNTTIDVSDPVTIEGQPLPKGTYGVHMIPGETSWVVIFSKNATSWGSFTYDQAEDALRVTVKPRTIEPQDALSYEFDNPTPTSTVITMRWERVAVPFTVEVNTPQIVAASLRGQLRARAKFEWQPWNEAANYLLTNKLSAEEALADAGQSIDIEERFENDITKARALSVLGRTDAARAAQEKALALGTQSQIHDFARGLQAQGRQDEALALFRRNITKDPQTWFAHNAAARLAVSAGDFAKAVAEMKLAVTAAPDALKGQHRDLVRRLEHNEDINK